jgi:hypothetical protein
VELKKVNLSVMRPWITQKVTDLLGFEDEVVIEYAMGLLEDPNATVRLPFQAVGKILMGASSRHSTRERCRST